MRLTVDRDLVEEEMRQGELSEASRLRLGAAHAERSGPPKHHGALPIARAAIPCALPSPGCGVPAGSPPCLHVKDAPPSLPLLPCSAFTQPLEAPLVCIR